MKPGFEGQTRPKGTVALRMTLFIYLLLLFFWGFSPKDLLHSYLKAKMFSILERRVYHNFTYGVNCLHDKW